MFILARWREERHVSRSMLDMLPLRVLFSIGLLHTEASHLVKDLEAVVLLPVYVEGTGTPHVLRHCFFTLVQRCAYRVPFIVCDP